MFRIVVHPTARIGCFLPFNPKGCDRIKCEHYKGNLIVTRRKSPSLYTTKNSPTFGHSDVYDHTDAAGFIRLLASFQGPGDDERPPEGLHLSPLKRSFVKEDHDALVRPFSRRLNSLASVLNNSLPWISVFMQKIYTGGQGLGKRASAPRVFSARENAIHWSAVCKPCCEMKVFQFTDNDEDIHTAVERRLTEIVGPVGGKLIPAAAMTRLPPIFGCGCLLNPRGWMKPSMGCKAP